MVLWVARMEAQQPVVTREGAVWVVRVDRGGHQQEYRCATEAQARQLQDALTRPK